MITVEACNNNIANLESWFSTRVGQGISALYMQKGFKSSAGFKLLDFDSFSWAVAVASPFNCMHFKK